MPTPPDADNLLLGVVGLMSGIGLWFAVVALAALALRRAAKRADRPPIEMPPSPALLIALGVFCGLLGGASMGWFAHSHVFWLMQIAVYAALWLVLSCFGWFWDLFGVPPEHRRVARGRAVLLFGPVGLSLAIGWSAVMLWRGFAG